ncbi:MAG TPA: hypothetical protein VKU39_08505, partial [Streptosporangiaceae bacterium]|nr:hypothetical protein [Streptosporangiaceae bacterium]
MPDLTSDLTSGITDGLTPRLTPGLTGGLTREWRPAFPLDVRLTLSVLGHGPGDPTFRADRAGALWRTSLAPD